MLLFWKQESEMTFRNAAHISYLIILIMCKCNNKIKEFWIFIYFTQFDDFWQSLVLLEKFFLSIQSQPPKRAEAETETKTNQTSRKLVQCIDFLKDIQGNCETSCCSVVQSFNLL